MKAMVLAAGEGTRLRPLTYTTPKVMLPLAGRPMLEYIVGWLRTNGIMDIAINLSHLPEVVMEWLGDGEKLGVRMRYSLEEQALGTAGALSRLRDFFDDTFLVVYGDMLTDMDVRALADYHRSKAALATLTLFEVEEPRAYGIVEVDSEGRIRRFVEKPSPGETTSNLANAAIYVLEPEVMDSIPSETFYDFGFDVFPRLLREGAPLYGYVTDAAILDAGTMENYRHVEQVLAEGRFRPPGVPI